MSNESGLSALDLLLAATTSLPLLFACVVMLHDVLFGGRESVQSGLGIDIRSQARAGWGGSPAQSESPTQSRNPSRSTVALRTRNGSRQISDY